MNSDMRYWSTVEVGAWLRRIGYSQYVAYFADNNIDGEALLKLSTEELFVLVKVFGDIFKVGDVVKFNTHLAQLRGRVKRTEALYGGRTTVERGSSPIPEFRGFGSASAEVHNEQKGQTSLVVVNDVVEKTSAHESETKEGPDEHMPTKEGLDEHVPKKDDQASLNSSNMEEAAANASASYSKSTSPAPPPPIGETSAAASYQPDLTRQKSSANGQSQMSPTKTTQQPSTNEKPSRPLPVISGNRPPLPSAHLSQTTCLYYYPQPKTNFLPEPNTFVRGYVSYAESPLEFSLVLERPREQVKKIGSILNRFYETDPCVLPMPPEQIRSGTACAVKYSDDNQWYRAKIISVDGDEVLVRYVDYGNSEKQSRRALMALKRDRLTQEPPLCVDCTLTGIPPGTPVTDEHKDRFYDLVEPMERMFLIKFQRTDGSPPYPVQLMDVISSVNVNARMMDMLGIEAENRVTREVTLVERAPQTGQALGNTYWEDDMEFGVVNSDDELP